VTNLCRKTLVRNYGDAPLGDVPFENLQNMTDDVPTVQAAVDAMEASGGGDSAESHVPALYAVASGCTAPEDPFLAPDEACTDPTLIGYPRFRAGAVPIIVLFTDAPFHNGRLGSRPYDAEALGFTPTTYDVAVAALGDLHARVISVYSADWWPVVDDLEQLCVDTDTLDAEREAYVYRQDDGEFGPLVRDAVDEVAQGVPMAIAARGVDDPADDVDAMDFVSSIVPAAAPAPPCATGLAVAGDSYVQVQPGTTVCFDVIPARNETVEPTAEPQMFKAIIQVWGDEVTVLDERAIYFLVPPTIAGSGGLY
jgi:hypothetical protein